MDDLISRQAAISHVDDVPYIKDHPNVGLLWKAWIESLPSAQPEQRWIPCSERMPEDGNYVLITTFGKVVASYFDVKVDAWRSEGAIYGTRTVQAWRPFPDPYKE